MRIIAFIEEEEIIKKIPKHLGLWDIEDRPPPKEAKAQPKCIESYIDYSDSQLPPSDNYLYVDYEDPE